ncbi:MAG: TIGR03435 family protein [Acidobacteriia bacterium]|nr:TIGR03435 family protein [Terriglobia bacterium]
MIRTIIGGSLIVLTASLAFGQTAATLSFEVASVKPAPPPTEGRLMIRMGGGPGDQSDPGRINWENVSLRDILRAAYGVRDYQISGPDWMNSTRFNIVATLPPQTTREQVALMWQTLLKERFSLTLHRETKDLPAYALVVAKGGPKIQQAVDDPPTTVDGGAPGGPMARAGGGSFGPGGPRGGGPLRNGMMMMRGMGHLEAKGISLSQFVDMLSRQLDRPVEDQTALKGNYDIKLDYTPDESTNGMAMRMGMPMPMPRPEGGGEGRGPADATSDNGASLFTAVQTQLGLKLEAKKLPLDLLVIDHAERVATEN